MSTWTRTVVALAGKDVKLFLADRRAAVLCFVIPIVLASAFGVIFDRPTRGIGDQSLAILWVDEDQSADSRDLHERLVRLGRVQLRAVDRDEARRLMAGRSVGSALIVPQGFKDQSRVEVLHHPLASAEGCWAEGAAVEALMRRTAERFMPMTAGLIAELPVTVSRSATAGESGRAFDSYGHSFSGMTLQYLLFWGLESGLLFLRDRRNGMWRRIRVAPVTLGAALAGRGLATSFIALLQVLLTFGFGYVVFGIRPSGSIIGFLLLAAAVAVLSATVGLAVAAMGGTEPRARAVFVVVILGLSMLGGLWLPGFLLPDWVRRVGEALPTTWAMRGFEAVIQPTGSAVSSIVPVSAVCGFAVVFYLFAWIQLHRADGRDRRGYCT